MAKSLFLGLSLCILHLLLLLLLDPSAAQWLPDEPRNYRPPGQIFSDTARTSQGSAFQQNLEIVIKFFQENNPPNGYATCRGFGNSPESTVYGHSACYNMSTQPNCGLCLKQSYDGIQRLYPLTVGATFWINDSASRCRLRYETFDFVPKLALLGVIGPNGSAPTRDSPVLPRAPAPGHGHSRALLWGFVGGGVGFAFLILVAGCFVWRSRMYKKLSRQHMYQGASDDLEETFEGPVVFSYQDLSIATTNFSEQHILGRGGFGTVYKASLEDGTEVAVKKLSLQSKQAKEFVNEIKIITSIQHRNLAKLKGYCIERDERLLVYEYFRNGSLDQALFGSKINVLLAWQSRFQIAVGIARGLAYLHEESQVEIVHRDIKASNILLDDKLQPKISDFGISKLYGDRDFIQTRVAGTVGYMAPEYATQGRLTLKADVFSYGILIFEIVSGRKCVDPAFQQQEVLLVEWIWDLYKEGRMASCIDKKLGNDYVETEAFRLIQVAMLCTQDNEEGRPRMSDVMAMLLGYLDVGHPAPPYFGRNRMSSSTTSTSQGSTTQGSITQVTAR